MKTTHWQYLHIRTKNTANQFDALKQQGWELVGYQTPQNSTTPLATLKRPATDHTNNGE